MKPIIQLLAPELEPPPNYLRMKYLTPLHKMLAIMFYCNFMYAASSVSSTTNVPTANDIAAGLQGMQQLQNNNDINNNNDNDINNDSNSSEQLDHQIDLETAAVMKERVAESTRGGYDSRNVTFMVWLFDSGERYQHLLGPSVLADMKVAHQKDQGRKTKKGKPSKKRDYLRASCTRALAAIDPTIKETIPVKLEALEFKVFTRFLSTFKKRVTKRTKDVMEGEVVMNEKDLVIRLSPSSYDGACSALSHLFTESGITKEQTSCSKDLWLKLSSYKKGTRRLSAKEKKQHGLSTIEGKKPLPFAAYELLAKILFESPDPEHVPAHTFLLLEWNLISRAEYLVDSKIDAVSKKNDALTFDIGKTKTDQEGTKNIDHPWHVYSNTENPYIDPHLAFGRLLISNPRVLEGKCDLFEGSSQYERFNKIFLDIVSDEKYCAQFAALDMPPEHFGTHSIRKGAVTHIATGTIASPPIASICLRANWAMPGVLNRYIRFENAGDQFVGKCVSGRSRMSKEFAISQPYFDFSACTRVDGELKEKEVDDWIKNRMPTAAKSNDNVFGTFKMCVASLEKHRSFLDENLHTNSNVRLSTFMLETAPHSDCVTQKYPWNKTSATPELTGIPPDVLVLSEFESMRQQLADMKSSIKTDFENTLKSELDERDIGGEPYRRMNEMMDKLDKMYSLLDSGKGMPLSSPILGDTDGNIDDTGGGFDINNEDGEDIVIPLASDGAVDQLTRERTRKQLKERKITIGWHHGRMNPLPADWQYPNGVTLIQLINLWLIGIQRDNVPPLQKVSPHWVYHFDEQGRSLSKMRTVMRFVEQFGREKGVWVSSGWDGEKITTLWSAICEDFDPYMRTETKRAKNDTNSPSYHKSRKGQIAYSTIYKKLSEAGMMKGNKTRKRQKTGVDKVDKAVEERRMKVLAAKVEEEREANERAIKLADSMLRPLTTDEQRIANDAINGSGPGSEVVASHVDPDDSNGRDTVKRESMQTLKPKTWLNDEVINYYLKVCLAKRDEALCNGEQGRKRCHFFNSFFLQSMFREEYTIRSGEYDYSQVQRWSKKAPGKSILNLKHIICPRNIGNYHWALGVISIEEKRIQWYDSKYGTDRKMLNGLLQYVKDEYKREGREDEFVESEWKLVGVTKNTPRQANGKCEISLTSF